MDSTGAPHWLGSIQGGTNGVCPVGQPINWEDGGFLYCAETGFAADTLNLVVGYQEQAGCTGGTYLAAGWATNPYGNASYICPTSGAHLAGTFSQAWNLEYLLAPTLDTNLWTSVGEIVDTAAPFCVGDQVNWPKPAIAFDRVAGNQTVNLAVSQSCATCNGGGGGNRIGYYQIEPPIGCPRDGGSSSPLSPIGQSPTECYPIPGNGTTPCICGTTSCEDASTSTITGMEIDHLLPAMAYNNHSVTTDDFLSVIWYDNLRDGGGGTWSSVSRFGHVMGVAGADAGADKPSALSGFVQLVGIIQEVDAQAPVTKEIGLSPWNESDHFFAGSHGSNEIVNAQYVSQ